MDKREIVIDKSLESCLPNMRPIGQTWIFVKSWNEIEHIMRITKPVRLFLQSGFEAPPERIRKMSIPPLVIVVPKVRSLRFGLWMRYLPYLDFVIGRDDLLQDFQKWVKVEPYSINFQKLFRFPVPPEMEEILDFLQRIKKIRHILTDHQWRIFLAYGKTGEVSRVAEIMGRHPRTIRDQIARIEEKVDAKDLENIFRKPVIGLLSKLPGACSPSSGVAVSGKRGNKTGSGMLP
ncbi:hypothetical protein BOX24_08690 [Leptospirillum ferriphilum]|uniref:Uncharacterized protein n=3 Tax=Leptospirillum ferriphilum TaxID=178606 RepID=A0A059Y364_9BACT|nr:hypothetical protein Y981_12695 [Leptospirillum ferriphilum YSK]OOH71579.1 hypothetical protein BOX24_08690 [Leptospirillum ferriphilum]